MPLEWWIKWIEITAKSIPIIVALLAFVKWGKPIWSFIRDLAMLPIRIKKIEYELKPNSGQSIKDSVNRIEVKQRLNEQRLLSVIDIIGDLGAYETDENGFCVATSLGYCHMVGRSQSESLGHGWINNILKEDRESAFKEWHEAVKYSRVFDMDYRMVKDDDVFWVNSRATPLHDDSLKVVRWFGIIKKIKKQVEIDSTPGF